MRLAKLFLIIPFNDKLLVLETMFWLSFFQILILLFPSKKIAKCLGVKTGQKQLGFLTHTQKLQAVRITQTVSRVNNHLPWHNRCLVRALAAKVILRRRGVLSLLFLGIF